MADWKLKAFEILPEMRAEIAEAENPMALWLNIQFEFFEAYKEPRREDFIRRVYEFESWCMEQDSEHDAENDLPTCVVVCFWEHIPTDTEARKDMPRWFNSKEVLANAEAFSYFLSSGNFEALLDDMSRSNLEMEREPCYLPADA